MSRSQRNAAGGGGRGQTGRSGGSGPSGRSGRSSRWAWGPPLVVAGLLLVGSIVPVPGTVPVEPGPDIGFTAVLHLLGYAVLAYTLGSPLERSPRVGRPALVAILAATGFGAGIEGLQLAIPYRTGSAIDVLLNGVGATVGVLLRWSRRHREA